MRYSFYQYFSEEGNVFRLYIQTFKDGVVRCYEFKTNIKAISNEPGVTRLFGKEVFDIAGNYFLFPLDFDNVETGDFLLVQEEPKFTKLNFINEDTELKGEWILRRLSTGEFLFWKPFPIVTTVVDRVITVSDSEVIPIVAVEQRFSVFEVKTKDNRWDGIAMAEGIWTGQDLYTTYFNKDIVESIYQQLSSDLENQLVDYNHDLIHDGTIDKVSIHTENGIRLIRASGTGNKPIPGGSGLSLLTQSKLKWDNSLNVYVSLSSVPKGVSIITESNPACTICMIR